MSRALLETKELLEKAGHTVSVLEPYVYHIGARSWGDVDTWGIYKQVILESIAGLITDDTIMQGKREENRKQD